VGAVSVGGIPLFHEAFRGLTFAVDFMPAPSAASLDALAARLAEGRGGDAYAAIIVEPLVMGAGGMVMYGAEHLRRLRALADAHDTLLIADEVLTGCGRTGTMFACEGAGVTPDLMCLSKGLTAGYMPLGVTMTTQRVFDAFYVDPNANGGEHAGKTFFHGHTFTGHPLACAVAVKSLELFEKNGVMAHVERLRPILAEALGRARGGRGGAYVRGARQCGLIGAIDLGWPDGGSFPYHWRVGGEVCARLRGRGIFLRPLADTLVIMPPLAVGEETLRRLCAGVLEGITWVEEIVGRKAAGG
jgi:adenosylmethionine-8-amino-7-oxononanoate aminotransferase